MAIASAAFLRRFARTECLALLLVLVICLAGSAVAQAPAVPTVTSGSVMPLDHTQTGQIYDIVFASTGDMIFLDTSHGALYQLKPDGKTFVTLSAPGSVFSDGGWQNAGMVIDSHDTLYITDRWDGTIMYRVPYANGTWSLTASSDSWIISTIPTDPATNQPFVLRSSAAIVLDPTDATGHTLIFSRETPDMSIIKLTLDANGAPQYASYILLGLKKRAAKMAIDKYGTLYFIEEPWLGVEERCVGVFMVPKGYTDQTGDGTCTLESKLQRIDPPNTGSYFGVSTDAAGNVYLAGQVNGSYGGQYDMVVQVPSELQGDGVTYVPNRDHASIIAPVSAATQPVVDSRGFMWIPVGTNGWDNIPGTYNFIKWYFGSAEVPPAEVGTTGTNTVRVYYGFNDDVTPDHFAFSGAGTASEFVIKTNAPPATTECVPGTTYHKWGGCYVQVALKPSVAGDILGQLQMFDASNHVLATTNIHGVGQASAVAALTSAVKSSIGSALSGQRQLAVDGLGNVYLADSTLVRKFAAGTTANPTLIGSGTLVSPTGVAVDGNQNVYIADSGKIYLAPYLSSGAYGRLVTLTTGLGNLGANARLAVDGNGNVYAADPGNRRIVKVFNSLTPVVMSGRTATTVGSGLTTPSAIASDAAGNLVVADGTNIISLPAIGGKVAIANGVQGIKGLALDASGSIYLAQTDGLRRIPSVLGGWNTSAITQLGMPDVTAPTAVAVDNTGNIYASQGTSIAQLTIHGAVDFNAGGGSVVPNLEAPAQLQLFNIGNLPLSVFAPDQQVFSDPMFEVIPADDSPNCDPVNPTDAGAYCWLGLGMTAAQAGDFTGTLTVKSNAVNGSPNVALKGTAVADNRPATSLAVTATLDKADYPAKVTIRVIVTSASGTPTGTVTLAVSSLPKQILTLENGSASIQFTDLPGSPSTVPEAPYKVRASYGGDGTAFAASGGTTEFKVTRAASHVNATATYNFQHFVEVTTDFIIHATVGSQVTTPTGKVRFVEGQAVSDPLQPYATVDANGDVAFTTKNLDDRIVNGVPVSTIPSGTVSRHVITAVYDGDINYAPSTSNAITVDLINKSVYVDTTNASFSITSGTPQTKIVTLSPLAQYGSKDNTQSLLCTNLPLNSQCTFDAPLVSVYPPDHNAVPVQVTISTNLPVNVGANTKAPLSGGSPWLFASMMAVGAAGLIFGRKTKYNGRVLMIVCVLLLLAGAVAGISACGNAGYYKQPDFPKVTTPAGTYHVTIIAIDGQTRQNVALPNTITVTVQ